MVEIVGFWTDDYLERKLSGLRSANIDNLILCVDAARACADDTLPCHAQIVPFRRRVPTADVLRIIDPRPMLADPVGPQRPAHTLAEPAGQRASFRRISEQPRKVD